MHFFLTPIFVLSILQMSLAEIYYPPILSPKEGDLIPIGSNFTVIWNNTVPIGLAPENVANSTSVVSIGFYFPGESPVDHYLFWHIFELDPPPNSKPGWINPFNFYRNKKPLDSGYGWAEFNIDSVNCAKPGDQWVIGWYDSPMTISGSFRLVGKDCVT